MSLSAQTTDPAARTTPGYRASAFDWSFFRRTAVSTIVASVLVALPVALYGTMALGARYLFFALWSLSFFALSALIFRHLLFLRNPGRGWLFIGLKFASMALVLGVLVAWPFNPETERGHGIAMIAGITTPLAVVVLRALGRAKDAVDRSPDSDGSANSGDPSESPRGDASLRAARQAGQGL